MGTSLIHLGLTTRSHGVLRRGGLHTIEDVKAHCTEEQLLRLRNAGPTTVAEVLGKLDAYSLEDWRI